MTQKYENDYGTPVSAPFRPALPVRSLADIRKLEETPLEQALKVRSTYEIFRNAGHAFGDKTALTFLRTGNPAFVHFEVRQGFDSVDPMKYLQ